MVTLTCYSHHDIPDIYFQKDHQNGQIKAIHCSKKIFSENNRIHTCVVKEHKEICMLIAFLLYNENITTKEIHS